MEPNEVKALHNLPYSSPIHLHSLSHSHKPNSISSFLYIQPGDEIERPHDLSFANPSQNPDSTPFYFTPFFPDSQTHIPSLEFSPNTSSLSNDTTSDEAKKLKQSIINERRLKRMTSNRESARRSRMRRKKQVEQLYSQVQQVQTTNHQLSEKLSLLFEYNQQILQENAELKEKVYSLQIALFDLLTPLRNAEDVTHNVNRVRAEASTLSFTCSRDLLH